MLTWDEYPGTARYILVSECGTYRVERSTEGWKAYKSGTELGTYRAMRYAMAAGNATSHAVGVPPEPPPRITEHCRQAHKAGNLHPLMPSQIQSHDRPSLGPRQQKRKKRLRFPVWVGC